MADVDYTDNADLANYLSAICETMRSELIEGGAYRCSIPVLDRWAITGDQMSCRRHLEARVIAWALRRIARKESLPEFAGLRQQPRENVLPDVFTERLRLVPATAVCKAASSCSRTALAALLDVRVGTGWAEALDTVDAAISETEADVDLHSAWHALNDPTSTHWTWMIVHRADNTLIGEIGTSYPPGAAAEEDNIQIVYWLTAAYRGHGYMTEAARAYTAWAFTQPHLSWIYATTAPDNIASRRVLEKLGARQLAPREGQDSDSDDDWIEWLEWEIRPQYAEQVTPQ